MMNDLSLVAQVTVFGNKRAFDALVGKYQSSVRRFFLNQTLGDGQLSDDLAQETFIKAYTHLSMFRGAASFQTWIFSIAYHVFYDYMRSHHHTTDVDGLPERAATVNPTLKMDIYEALALLKPEERTCITLQLIDGYDIVTIAKITQMKEGTVKSHLSRGKEKMVQYLKKNGYDGR